MSVPSIKKFLCRKRTIVIGVLLVIVTILYFAFFHTLTINPLSERAAMARLEATKSKYELTPFTTDGCSGSVSSSWHQAVTQFAKVSEGFANRYEDTTTIPFEAACIEHDRVYHAGEGGYRARFFADNVLRADIISYALKNTDDIKARTGLQTDEEVLFLYELVADSVYRGVRLGGAPCTGMPYAWGYGYGGGVCE